MKYLLLAILAGAAGWFYLIDGSRLDEAMVREFYGQQGRHTYERDPQALCGQIGKTLTVRVENRFGGKATTASYGKAAACRHLRNAQKFFEEMGERPVAFSPSSITTRSGVSTFPQTPRALRLKSPRL
jgi:hypothetical protein